MASDLPDPFRVPDEYMAPAKRRPDFVLWVVAVCAWLLALGIRLSPGLWDTNRWVLGPVWLGALGVAIVGSVLLVGREVSRSRWARSICATGLVGILGFTTIALTWNATTVHGYYQVHRAQFTTLATLARQDQLGCGSFDGRPQPSNLRELAVNGKIEGVDNECPGPTGAFVARSQLLLEGGAGYAWFPTPPPDDTQHAGYVIFDDPAFTCWSLGNGWYYMETGPYTAPTMKERARHC
jgi:hypothetical protein